MPWSEMKVSELRRSVSINTPVPTPTAAVPKQPASSGTDRVKAASLRSLAPILIP